MLSCHCEGAVTQAEGPAVAVPPPPQIDPVKAAADAEAEALKLAQLEALKKMNVVRRWCVKISTHEDFEFVVFVLIFANIVTLAMYNPLKSDSSGYNFILDRIREPAALPDADLALHLEFAFLWMLHKRVFSSLIHSRLNVHSIASLRFCPT